MLLMLLLVLVDDDAETAAAAEAAAAAAEAALQYLQGAGIRTRDSNPRLCDRRHCATKELRSPLTSYIHLYQLH